MVFLMSLFMLLPIDALAVKPSWGRIGLYAAITLALGVTAFQEARYLSDQLEEEGEKENRK